MPQRPSKIAANISIYARQSINQRYVERSYDFTKIGGRLVTSEFKHDGVYLLPSQKRQCSGVGIEDVRGGSASEKRVSDVVNAAKRRHDDYRRSGERHWAGYLATHLNKKIFV